MKDEETLKFSGLLNQNEFSQRLHLIRSRIANKFSMEELAFLLGRTSHFIKDFEELRQIKLNWDDVINHTFLFRTKARQVDRFDPKKNGTEISYEKRMLRGQKLCVSTEIIHRYVHPWTWKGVCKPIVIREPVKPECLDTEVDELEDIMSSFIRRNYFKEIRSPIEIYKYMFYTGGGPTAKMILPLRNALYRLVSIEQLQVRRRFDKLYFTVKTSGAHSD